MTDENRQSPAETVSHAVAPYCSNCAHSFGPIVLMCGRSGGEFSGGPVHLHGYCDGHEQLIKSHRPEGHNQEQ